MEPDPKSSHRPLCVHTHYQYPCIGEWNFLFPILSNFSEYHDILSRARAGATILDLGCCFGQELRLLAANGVPTKNLYGSDLKPVLWNLGFDLFRDRNKMEATFIEADVFDPNSELRKLQGRMDIIIACNFLHLFDWEQQITAMKRIVDLSRVDSVIIGHQIGHTQAQEVARPWGQMYMHNEETFRKIWRQVEAETGTRLEVKVSMVDVREWGLAEKINQPPFERKGLKFLVKRLDDTK